MTALATSDIVRAIEARVARNDPGKNSTWDAATRTEIAMELGVDPADVSREGGEPDGPLGDAIAEGSVAPHPKYDNYYRVVPR